jgi:hypothetical protein
MTPMDEIPASDWRRWRGRVLVRCPGCREELPLDHTVRDDGLIEPSLDCPNCPYHAYAKLVGWTPAPVKET